MHISQLSQSRFLKKEDVGNGMNLTISHITEEEIGTEDEPKRGFVLHWREQEKPMCINVTNANIIAGILGTEETDEWAGQVICLYNDPSVMYKGKRTGGIRIRPAGAVQQPAQMRPDPRQTPHPQAYQQAAQQRAPMSPSMPRPPMPAAPRPPAPPAYTPPPAEDAPWPSEGQM
jgi:hypothetical protein